MRSLANSDETVRAREFCSAVQLVSAAASALDSPEAGDEPRRSLEQSESDSSRGPVELCCDAGAEGDCKGAAVAEPTAAAESAFVPISGWSGSGSMGECDTLRRGWTTLDFRVESTASGDATFTGGVSPERSGGAARAARDVQDRLLSESPMRETAFELAEVENVVVVEGAIEVGVVVEVLRLSSGKCTERSDESRTLVEVFGASEIFGE